MVIKTYTKGGITFQKNTYTGELKRIKNQSVRDDPQEYRPTSSSSKSSSSKNKLRVVAPSVTAAKNVAKTKSSNVVKISNNRSVPLRFFGTNNLRGSTVTYGRDGSLRYELNGEIVREYNSKGVQVTRIGVGGSRSKRIKRITPSIIYDQKGKDANTQQRKLNAAFNKYLDYQGQSIDPNKLKNRSIIPIIKNGKVWGYKDYQERVNVGFSSPLSEKQVNSLLIVESKRQPVTKTVGSGKVKPIKRNSVTIDGVEYKTRTPKEKQFLEFMKVAITTSDGWDEDFYNDITKKNLSVNITDKWYRKALKGAGLGFAGIKELPKVVAKVMFGIRGEILKKQSTKSLKKAGLTVAAAQAKAGYKTSRQVRSTTVIPSVIEGVKSFNPAKPENWFNIALFILTAPASAKPVKNTVNKFKKSYVPSTRNTNTFKVLVEDQLSSLNKAKKVIKSDISAGKDVFLNKRLLNKVVSVERNLKNGYGLVEKAIKNPNVLKLSDFNPLVKSSKVLGEMGKENLLFHATGAKVKNLLGNKFKQLKSEVSILKSVRKASGVAKRGLKPTSNVERYLISFVKRNKGVISGGKAQNVFVKRLLKRKTIDYDVLIKNNKLVATKFLASLKKRFPKDNFELKVLSPPNQNFKVYRIKWNGRDLIDFDPIPKDLGKTVNVGGVKVASPEFLAKRKASTIGDIKKGYRQAKDTKDLQRLTGNVFNDKKLFSKLRDPKDAFTVRPQPKGMGADRIKFNEDQMFFDLEVPTSYAYNAIGVRSLTQKAVNSLSKLKLPKGFKAPGKVTNKLLFDKFVKKINSYKFIKSNSKITVIKLSCKIDRLSPSLMKRVKNAGSLSAKESAKLRVDVNNYINKNLDKVLGGSRTLSKGFGEREFVSPVGSRFYKQSLKKSFDYDTNTFIDVLEVAFKRAKKSNLLSDSSSTGNGINRLRLASFNDLKNNFFTPKDFLKVKKFRRALLKSEKLSTGDYNDIVSITVKMLRNKNGSAAFSRLKAKESKILNLLKAARRDKVYVIKKPSLAKAISLVSVRTKIKPSKASKVKPRVVSRARSKSRVKPRVVSRARSKSRVKPRVSPRVKPRVSPRVRPRVSPRVNPRTINKLRKIKVFSFKRKKIKFSKDEIKYMLSKIYVKGKYRPSLAAVIYGITGFKAPKSLTGFELRPILKKK